MGQHDLLPASGSAVIDRPLIAFAFLAQATQVQGDLMSGLAPIFKPIAKQRVGKRFDADEFAAAVAALYGIKIHPWAVEDLATRLEKSGLLIRTSIGAEASEYVYANVEGTFDDVTESHIRQVVQRFVDFAKPVLARLGATLDEKLLEEGFFDELTTIDFHSILLKPEGKDPRSTTLALKQNSDEQQYQQSLTARAHLDVLCAAFIVDTYHNDRPLYDLVARIATGALLSEVVLNLQDPGKTASLLTLRVLLDAPLVMSVLDLSSEESYRYTNELRKALKEHDATIEVFRHSLDEVRDNLKAVMVGVSQGAGFGATARRLQSPAFSAYVRGVLQDLDAAVNRAGIRVVESPSHDAAYRFFTEEDEEYFHGMLGSFWNPLAQSRDAASIAGVMRLRQGRRTRMSAFHQAQYVFVTQNPRVADASARLLVSRKLGAMNEVPPAITDRFLAGLVWILYGGKAAVLTRYSLLASCCAALEVRNDVMAKVHRFLKDVDETKAKQFRAMMTDERAGQHLMQLTLGDTLLIPSTADAEQILESLEARFEDKHRARADAAIAEANSDAEQKVRRAEQDRESHAQMARDAATGELVLKGQLKEALDAVERERRQSITQTAAIAEAAARERTELNTRYLSERRARVEDKLTLIQECVRKALTASRRRIQLWALCTGGLLFIGAMLGTEFATQLDPKWSIVGALVTALVGAVSFWQFPDFLLGEQIKQIRERTYANLLLQYQLTPYVDYFTINWATGDVVVVENLDQLPLHSANIENISSRLDA
jgi:hypothetical protein